MKIRKKLFKDKYFSKCHAQIRSVRLCNSHYAVNSR